MLDLEIFGYHIPMYGVMFYTGMLAAAFEAVFLNSRRTNKKVKTYDIIYSCVFIFVGAITGAKLLFIIVSLPMIIEQNIPIEAIIKGGFVFYGGFIGGFLGLLSYVKMFKMKLDDFADTYAAAIPFGHAFGRIGCFFGGCCYGIEVDSPISYTYTQSYDMNTPLGVPLLPVQLIEAALLLTLGGVLLIIYFKSNRTYAVTFTYLISYAAIRFVLEFFRGDSERGVFILSTSQWISLLIIFSVIGFLIYEKRKMPKTAEV